MVEPPPSVRGAAKLALETTDKRFRGTSVSRWVGKSIGFTFPRIGDPVATAAMNDRLVHHLEILPLNGDSYRLRDRRVAGSKMKAATPLPAE